MVKKLPKYLKPGQVDSLFSKIPVDDVNDLVAFTLMFKPMLRVSEVSTLKVRDVDLGDKMIKIIVFSI